MLRRGLLGSFGLGGGILRSKKTKLYRGRLSGKKGNKHYWKGSESSHIGSITGKREFRLRDDLDSYLDLHIPDLEGFELKPYVALNTPKTTK